MNTGPFDRVKWARDVHVKASKDVSASAKRGLLMILATYTDRNWSCFPSAESLSAVSGLSERQVRSILGALTDDGLIERKRRSTPKGRTSDLFTLNGSPNRKPLPLAQPEAISAATGNHCRNLPEAISGEESTTEGSNEETSKTPSSGELFELKPPAKRTASDDGFAEWWAIYPKKVARGAAEKAFASVLKNRKATIAELMDGVTAYAASREGQDHRFTKHPATWLNDCCWVDEPAPASPPTTPRQGPSLSQNPLEIARRSIRGT